MRQIILDTETTGISPAHGHRIIEIGCLELMNRRITGNNFHVYINPEREIDEGAFRVHGLSNEFLDDKPLFADITERFLEFVRGAELVIHNAPFDIGFLNHELRLHDAKYRQMHDHCGVFDTLPYARRMHPGQKNSLDALCKRYFVDNTNRELHGALLDAELLAQVYLAMTGGQVIMFPDNLDHQIQQIEESPIERLTQAHSLPVLVAEPTELDEHAAFLDIIRSANAGRCAWDD
ncbi:MAG: DNA polymerase III subunit epsilon [Pseudomonadota bacterium]|nr:DNA polymerase III subunit epsilon [Pseudomonadota bacterium]